MFRVCSAYRTGVRFILSAHITLLEYTVNIAYIFTTSCSVECKIITQL